MEKSGKPKKPVLRPLFWWFLLVLALYGIRTNRRLMEKTRLDFNVTLQGQTTDASATFDGKPAFSGQKISLGNHTFTVTLPKGEPFSTNLFVWYGEHNLGTIDLKRTMGTLLVTANPPAPLLVIRGPEWSVTLTNSSGLKQSVPTDAYFIEADYPHWRKNDSAGVFANQTTYYNFAPHFGGLQLGCNRPDATYQLQASDGRLIANGSLPATVTGLPAGDYKVFATHHRHQRTETLTVKGDATTPAQIDFNYGVAVFETTPAGAMVETTGNGQHVGVTPLTLGELLPGDWSFTLQRNGYQTVQVSLVVTANQTNFVSTNLVGENYLHAMYAARRFLAAADYGSALKSAGDALASRPGDADATTLQNEATGLGHIQRAKALGNLGEYIEGGKELALALESLPDDAEAKQLAADFKRHEPEEVERMRVERLNLPQKMFDALCKRYPDSKLFDEHELKTSKAAEAVADGISEALLSAQPPFELNYDQTPAPEIHLIIATQKFTTGILSFGERECMIIVGQTKDDECQILFKVLEYQRHHTFDMNAPLSRLSMNEELIPVSPTRIPNMTDKLKAQLQAGVSNLTVRIQGVIGQTPKLQPMVPQ